MRVTQDKLDQATDISEVYADRIQIDPITNCWLWLNSQNGIGYGLVTVDYKHYYAHRLAYQISYGKIPKGMNVLHKCDVRNCCNPQHLWLGTQKDNLQDAAKKQRLYRQIVRKARGGYKRPRNDPSYVSNRIHLSRGVSS